MKKRDVINLIKYHVENNDSAFREEAYDIVADFNNNGDLELGRYVLSLLSDKNTFIPQIMNNRSDFIKRVDVSNTHLFLPTVIMDDLKGIINAANLNAGVNKFLFQGFPGTGKTESAKQLARILERELFIVDFDSLIDSKLGQTSRNIAALFSEINDLPYPEKVIILFDEIDSLALDRIDSRDHREMGRATSSVLKGFDSLNDSVIIIATTNLFDNFDSALVRRFDKIINFNRYSKDDLMDVAEKIADFYLNKFSFAGRNMRLLKKIISLASPIPYPGELANLIKTAIVFSNSQNEYEYLIYILKQIKPELVDKPKLLKDLGFTLREIEILTNISKSTLSREFSR